MTKPALALLTLLTAFCSGAATQRFNDGPVIKDYGKHAQVKQDLVLDTSAVLKVVFDLSEQGEQSKMNQTLNSLARFINMHVANGFAAENIQLALVVHGKASFDVMNNAAYKNKFSQKNPNNDLINALIKNNVQIYLCGQSAAYYSVDNSQLHSGVKMALSAMTAHALLQQQGYTLNPF